MLWYLSLDISVPRSSQFSLSLPFRKLFTSQKRECSQTNILAYFNIKWKFVKYIILVYTTQVNNTFHACWLASSEVISQVLFTSEQLKKNKMAFASVLSQIKLLFGLLVIQLVWYILKQLVTSVAVKVVDIYCTTSRLGKYPPLFTSTSVNNC